MRRFIFVWLLLSLAATAWFGYQWHQGAYSYRSLTSQSEPAARTYSTESSERFRNFGPRSERNFRRSPPAQGENLALTISIASSIISALAAIAQTWLTHRAIRNGKSGA